MPIAKVLRPLAVAGGVTCVYGSLDWGRLARIHLLDDRQHRDAQACPRPGRGGSNTVPLADCAALADPRRTLLGDDQERWLAGNWALDRPWNLLAQQTLMTRFSWTDPGRDASYWTDGWDGYPAARQRLLGTAADRRVPGVVLLGGDAHAHYVADLKADFDDSRAPVVATEFCGTSISSLGLAQQRVDAARGFNPHVHWARADQREAMRFRLDAQALEAQLMVVENARDPASGVSTQARFGVASRQPGAQRAYGPIGPSAFWPFAAWRSAAWPPPPGQL